MRREWTPVDAAVFEEKRIYTAALKKAIKKESPQSSELIHIYDESSNTKLWAVMA